MCLLSKSRTITLQGIIILATISTEKHTLVFYSSKILTSQWSLTCKSRVPGQGVCLLSKSRTITLQGIIILATISTEKHTLVFYST